MPIEIKLSSFKFTVESHTNLVTSEDQRDLVLRFNLKCHGEAITANGTKSDETPPKTFDVYIDKRHFRDTQQLKDWIEGTWRKVWEVMSGQLLGETIITYKIAMEKTASDMGIAAIDLKDVVQEAAHIFTRANKEILELRKAGRPRTWTKEGLDQAVRKASLKFKKDKYRSPTLTDVAASISKHYPDRMPLNAKSLGQMLKRYELEWKNLKNPQK